MTDDVAVTQSIVQDLGAANVGVAYVLGRDTPAPRVGLAVFEVATGAESTIEARPGEPFQIAGETWQVAEVRKPTEPDWAVILRRIA